MPVSTPPALQNAPTRGTAVPYYIKASALGLSAYLIGIHIWTWVFNIRIFLAGRADFRQLYTAGYLLRAGYRHQLYDYALQTRFENLLAGPSDTPLPFNHLAYESVLFAPLSLASYQTAYLLFLLINISLLAICFFLLRPHTTNLARVYFWLPIALFAAFLPIAAALIQGQDSIILLTLFTACLLLLTKGSEQRAGALLGLALFKFELVLPVALLFALWRRWKFVTGFTISGAAVLLLSFWLVGFAQMGTYAHWLMSMSLASGPSENLRNAITPNHMPNLRGLIYGLAGGHIPALATQALTIIVSAALFFWIALKSSARPAPCAFLIAITVAVLVSYHLLLHDMSVLFLPLVCVLDACILTESHNPSERRLLAAATFAFCAPLAESFFPSHLYLASIPVLIFLWALMSPNVAECTVQV